jgi:hypothetical protein
MGPRNWASAHTREEVDKAALGRIKTVVRQVWEGQVDPPDAVRQLSDLIHKTADAYTRVDARAGE